MKTHQVKILRNCKVAGELKRPGDVVEVGEIDFNTMVHFAKAIEIIPPADGGPVADERETELREKMTRRARVPKAPPAEIIEDETPEEE